MTRLRDRLDALESALREVGSPLVEHLRPGLGAGTVVAELEARGVVAHEDLITWFGWHDGTDVPSATDPPGALLQTDDNRLIFYAHVPSFEEALVEYDGAVALEHEGNPSGASPLTFSPAWFPVLSCTGWTVCLDTTGSATPLGSPVVYDVWRTEHPPPAVFDSLAALVDAVIDAYATGRFTPTQLTFDVGDLPASAVAFDY